ncbi:hypothetical protein LCGC14_0608840 [marine sediment metagenome]|uniref:Uncharacterized protein n=1 Tax=marine sediment metagenome TaxID=412755 RepID=A0A0F9UGW8_9ZZZZ
MIKVRVRDLIELLAKMDWDSVVTIAGVGGTIKVVESVTSKTRIDIYATGITIDKFNRRWKLPSSELCDECGQPHLYGNCNHKKLTRKEVMDLGGVTK